MGTSRQRSIECGASTDPARASEHTMRTFGEERESRRRRTRTRFANGAGVVAPSGVPLVVSETNHRTILTGHRCSGLADAG
jgi:hypothetical protein